VTARNAFGLRIVAALAVLVGGAVHLQQWLTVFRDQSIGPSFLVNAVASLVVAIALVATDDRVVRGAVVAGLALSIGSLLALLASRTVGLPGFEATGYDTAEIEAIAAELVAGVLLGVTLVVLRGTPRSEAVPTATSRPPLGVG
jgi:drug/metabolite transporter (DMT)-like permease